MPEARFAPENIPLPEYASENEKRRLPPPRGSGVAAYDLLVMISVGDMEFGMAKGLTPAFFTGGDSDNRAGQVLDTFIRRVLTGKGIACVESHVFNHAFVSARIAGVIDTGSAGVADHVATAANPEDDVCATGGQAKKLLFVAGIRDAEVYEVRIRCGIQEHRPGCSGCRYS